MFIYQAFYMDYGEYYEPLCELGIYTDLELAKSKALESTQFLNEEPQVYVLRLNGKEFKTVGTWIYNKENGDQEWFYEADVEANA